MDGYCGGECGGYCGGEWGGYCGGEWMVSVVGTVLVSGWLLWR